MPLDENVPDLPDSVPYYDWEPGDRDRSKAPDHNDNMFALPLAKYQKMVDYLDYLTHENARLRADNERLRAENAHQFELLVGEGLIT